AARKVYESEGIKVETMKDRIKHVVDSCFAGKRIIIFSGGETKSTNELLEELKGIAQGGGFGSIMGRNAFQRPKKEAIELLHRTQDIFRGEG
ncbi:MAG: fructose-bisphosphate aldolase, partial [Bdellovibrionota bacterium]